MRYFYILCHVNSKNIFLAESSPKYNFIIWVYEKIGNTNLGKHNYIKVTLNELIKLTEENNYDIYYNTYQTKYFHDPHKRKYEVQFMNWNNIDRDILNHTTFDVQMDLFMDLLCI